jgi:hypothetical protein
MLSWSLILPTGGWRRRAVGVFGSVSAVVLIIALLVAPAKLTTHLLMMAIGLRVIWYLSRAALLTRRTIGD